MQAVPVLDDTFELFDAIKLFYFLPPGNGSMRNDQGGNCAGICWENPW